MDFQCEYFVCKNDIQRQKTLARFNEKYRNLPSERFADELCNSGIIAISVKYVGAVALLISVLI